jgi:hypothetical protein
MGWIVPNIFKAMHSLKMSEIIYPIIRSHVAKDMNPNTNFLKNSKVTNTEKNKHPCFKLMNNVFVTWLKQ